MESRFVVTAFIFSILAACSKNAIQENSFYQLTPVQQKEKQPHVYSSDWETIPAWTVEENSDATVFSYSRQMPELNSPILSNAAVLVFARNLWADDPDLNEQDDTPETPLLMPFYFLPYFEKPNYTQQWSYVAAENTINIWLLVSGAEGAAVPDQKIQLRFIVIPEEVLNRKRHSVQSLRKLSYGQLVKTFNLST